MQVLSDILGMRQALATLPADAAPAVRAEQGAALAEFEAEARAHLSRLNAARREAWEMGNMAGDERSMRMAGAQLNEINGRIAEINAVLEPEESSTAFKAPAAKAQITNHGPVAGAKASTADRLAELAKSIYSK
jgi:hypothetical protein